MKEKSRRRSPWIRGLGIVFYTVVLAVFCLGGIVANMASHSSLFRRALTNPWAILNVDPGETFRSEDGITLLVLGCDEVREHVGFDNKGHSVSKVTKKYARADMILVTRLDFKHKTISGLSIPRDTSCRLPGYSSRKITGYHNIAKKGEEDDLMQQAVEHVLPGVHIDRTVVIDYDAFKDLVNVVGGVTVNVPEPMDYDDDSGQLHIHLKPGKQTLEGSDAMGYVRFRHDKDSDYGRQQRQKEFLASFKSSIFKNPFRLAEVAEQGKEVLNNKLNDEEIIAIASFARNVPPASIKLGMLPTRETDTRGGALRVDEDKREDAMRKFGLLPEVRTAAVER